MMMKIDNLSVSVNPESKRQEFRHSETIIKLNKQRLNKILAKNQEEIKQAL